MAQRSLNVAIKSGVEEDSPTTGKSSGEGIKVEERRSMWARRKRAALSCLQVLSDSSKREEPWTLSIMSCLIGFGVGFGVRMGEGGGLYIYI